MENFMKFMEEWDNHMFDALARSPLKIINFGENLDCNLGNAYPRQPASSFKGPVIKDINKSKRNIGIV